MFTKDLYLAGGSFHGLQEVFSRIYGVVDTQAGYANSCIKAPTKEQVADGSAEAVECVKVTYNPKKIDIGMLLNVFFTIINPYTDGIQGNMSARSTEAGSTIRARRTCHRSATSSFSCRIAVSRIR